MIYLLTDNIFFSSKIAHNLKANGLDVKVFTSPEAMNTALDQDAPSAILVNLNAQKYDPAATITALKADNFPAPVIAFCGHSDTATYEKGKEAGADRILANSAITMNAVQSLKDAGVEL